MGRLAERTAELAAEMGRGESRSAGDLGDVERLRVPRVDQVLRTEQVPGRKQVRHAAEYGGPPRLPGGLLQAGDIPFRVATFCVARS